MRPIDADALLDKFLRHYTEQEKKGNLSFVACEIKQFFADIVNEAPTIEPQRWIPASEPPKEYRDKYGELIPFLVCEDGTEYPFRAMYDGKCWGDGIYAIPVKWWMPLPEPPKEDEND